MQGADDRASRRHQAGGPVLTVLSADVWIPAILDALPDNAYLKDSQSRFLHVNPAMAAWFGVADPAELVGKTDFDLFSEEHARQAFDDEQEIVRTGRPLSGKRERETWPDGRETWVSSSKAPVCDSDGRVVGIFGVSRDITAQMLAEQEAARGRAVTAAVNHVLLDALTCHTEADIARSCLAVAEQLTDSAFGFIGELNPAGRFDTLALSDPGWEACGLPAEEACPLLRDMTVSGLWGAALRAGEAAIVNDPATAPGRAGLPDGHPPLESLLAVPLRRHGEVIGLLALANRAGGYRPADQHAVEALAVAFVEALDRQRAETERDRLIDHLQTALADVKRLTGLLPMCAWCHKIRDDAGYWKLVEQFLCEQAGTQFSHGICPQCMTRLFPDDAISAAWFTPFDLRDVEHLLLRLKTPSDPVSAYLRGHCAPAALRLIDQHDPTWPASNALIEGVVAELNRALEREDLYQEERFADVVLPPAAVELLGAGLPLEEVILRNRLLLEAVYPEGLAARERAPGEAAQS